jgi:hypothetical protein
MYASVIHDLNGAGFFPPPASIRAVLAEPFAPLSLLFVCEQLRTSRLQVVR